MDNPVVDTPREAPPKWARPVPAGHTVMTDKQKNFILRLRNERVLSEEQKQWIDNTLSAAVTKTRAGEIITRLLALPKAEREHPQIPDVPAGRYAVENAEGELRFYKVWRSKKGFARVYVLHGPDESQLEYWAMVRIMEKIQKTGTRNCAIRYGLEIGSCSNCGRRLTNRISRELGIGPVCGGRMFGDDYKADVKDKRAEILARGEDPDEEIE